VLRAQLGYVDRWPSFRVVARLVSALAADALRALQAIQARADAGEWAWALARQWPWVCVEA